MTATRRRQLQNSAEEAVKNNVSFMNYHLEIAKYFTHEEIAFSLNHYRKTLEFFNDIKER